MTEDAKAAKSNPRLRRVETAIRTNARVKWAKNTVIGTAKGVAIAAAAGVASDATKQALQKRLHHKRHH